MLVAYDDPQALANVSADEMQEIIARYMSWTSKIAEAGKLLSGEKLVEGRGRIVSRKSGALDVSEGPYTEAREVIGGIWIIETNDEREALDIAATCPHADMARLGFYEVDNV
jgi:hypothetical protein